MLCDVEIVLVMEKSMLHEELMRFTADHTERVTAMFQSMQWLRLSNAAKIKDAWAELNRGMKVDSGGFADASRLKRPTSSKQALHARGSAYESSPTAGAGMLATPHHASGARGNPTPPAPSTAEAEEAEEAPAAAGGLLGAITGYNADVQVGVNTGGVNTGGVNTRVAVAVAVLVPPPLASIGPPAPAGDSDEDSDSEWD